MANTFCSSWKSIQFTNENINKNIIQTTVWFSASRKKKKKSENIISHHKVKNRDFKTSKKGETKKSS